MGEASGKQGSLLLLANQCFLVGRWEHHVSCCGSNLMKRGRGGWSEGEGQNICTGNGVIKAPLIAKACHQVLANANSKVLKTAV
ncbi:hypothetical protein Taro_015601 [Colocasia esculenta]|uniref:Uncharacterized protein n=1 Tax=Colocasia esculenta TaxID=4460 RepID=A0A843UMN6_COLES|nr:hypothetical protein [Colocasia esculenta]